MYYSSSNTRFLFARGWKITLFHKDNRMISAHKDDPFSASRRSKLMTFKKVCFLQEDRGAEIPPAHRRNNPPLNKSYCSAKSSPSSQWQHWWANTSFFHSHVGARRQSLCSGFAHGSFDDLFGSKRCWEYHMWSAASHLWCPHVFGSKKWSSRWSRYE